MFTTCSLRVQVHVQVHFKYIEFRKKNCEFPVQGRFWALVGRSENPRCKITYPPPINGSAHFRLKMVEIQERNERIVSTMNVDSAVSFFEKRMFSHICRSKHGILSFKIDHLRNLTRIHCLAGMHRGFLLVPTRALGANSK